MGLGNTPFGDPEAKIGSETRDGSLPLADFQQAALWHLRLAGAQADPKVHVGRHGDVVDPRLVAAARLRVCMHMSVESLGFVCDCCLRVQYF